MINRHKIFFVCLLGGVAFATACSSLFKDYNMKDLENKEFDKEVHITEIPAPPVQEPGVEPIPPEKKLEPVQEKQKSKIKIKKEKISKVESKKEEKALEDKQKHYPDLEDGEGFVGRQPIENPFVIGEELQFSVRYFGVEAGKFTLTTKPFVEVNGKKSYHFSYQARSSSVFSLFYKVEDSAESYMDAEMLVPYSYTITARESKQVRDVKSFFNWKTNIAKTWDKKIKKGEAEPVIKDYQWDMKPYAQSVFSVPFYLRCFTLQVGKELAVNVAHEGENIIMRAKVVREEKLSTPYGKIDTFVIKPSFQIDGVFKPVGDIFLWLTKDKYKRIVRIESKIKIGTIVVSVEKVQP